MKPALSGEMEEPQVLRAFGVWGRGWLSALLGHVCGVEWGMSRVAHPLPPAVPAQGPDGPNQSSFLCLCSLSLCVCLSGQGLGLEAPALCWESPPPTLGLPGKEDSRMKLAFQVWPS